MSTRGLLQQKAIFATAGVVALVLAVAGYLTAAAHHGSRAVAATPPQENAPPVPPASAASGEPDVASGGRVGHAASAADLSDPHLKDVAMRLVSSAENSSVDWRAQYSYIEDIGDGRGYTAGIVGFCSGTGDMLALVEAYARSRPGNVLARYLPALRAVNGSAAHTGLDPGFPADWRTAAGDPAFRAAQDAERDRVYFNPALALAKADGLRPLGQFIYYDAAVMHGADDDGLGVIRRAAMRRARPPAQGGGEVAYLNAFLDARIAMMKRESAHDDTSRVDTGQRVFLDGGNLDLDTPLRWRVYGDAYRIDA